MNADVTTLRELLSRFQQHRYPLAAPQRLFMMGFQERAGLFNLILMSADVISTIQQILSIFFQQDGSFIHHDHFFEHIRCFLNDVGGDNKGSSRLSVFLHQQLIEALSCHHIQPCHRFIQKRELRLAGQSHNDGHHRKHTFRQLIEPFFLLQPELLYQSVRQFLIPVRQIHTGNPKIFFHFQGTGSADAQHLIQFSGKTKMLQYFRVLPHRFPVKSHRSGSGRIVRCKDGQQRCLSCPISTDQPVNLSGLQLQVNAMEHLIPSIYFCDSLTCQYTHQSSPPSIIAINSSFVIPRLTASASKLFT